VTFEFNNRDKIPRSNLKMGSAWSTIPLACVSLVSLVELDNKVMALLDLRERLRFSAVEAPPVQLLSGHELSWSCPGRDCSL